MADSLASDIKPKAIALVSWMSGNSLQLYGMKSVIASTMIPRIKVSGF